MFQHYPLSSYALTCVALSPIPELRCFGASAVRRPTRRSDPGLRDGGWQGSRADEADTDDSE